MPSRLESLTDEGQDGGAKVIYERQMDWYNPRDTPDFHVCVVGVGGIGSLTAILLSKLGIPKMTLIDPDTFEAHNIPNQFTPIQSVGQPKVKVIGSLCSGFGVSEIDTYQDAITHNPYIMHGVIVTGLDSMRVRKDVWRLLESREYGDCRWLIDGRMNGLKFTVWTINLRDQRQCEMYAKEALYTDEEGDKLPCTGRGVIDVSALIAGTITRQVRMIATKQEVESLISFEVNPRFGIYVPSYESKKADEVAPTLEEAVAAEVATPEPSSIND